MHVDQIDVEVVMGPKNSEKKENDTKSQETEKSVTDIKINENSTSSKVIAKESPKSPEERESSSGCKDDSTITFSSLKELHQMNAAKMFENVIPDPPKSDIETKENKKTIINPLFKSANVNVFTKDTKITNVNRSETSCGHTNSNSLLSQKISQPENRKSISNSQYPVLVTPESKMVRSWGGTSEGNKPEEDVSKGKSEYIKENSKEINDKLDPIRYFNELLSDVNFEDRFFQCPTSESLQNTFEEHLSSPLLFGETAESKSPTENIENKDNESETDLSSSVLKILDEVMNESLDLEAQKSSKDITESDLNYHMFTDDNLQIENKMGIIDLGMVRKNPNELNTSKDLEHGKTKKQIDTEEEINSSGNEINKMEINDKVKENLDDIPKSSLKIKLIKSPDSKHEWLSDTSYISNLDHEVYFSEKEVNESAMESFKANKKSANSNEIDKTANLESFNSVEEKEDICNSQHKNDTGLPVSSKNLSQISPGSKESDDLILNLTEDEMDDDCPISIAINSDDEVEVLDDGINHVNVDKVNTGYDHPLRCRSADTQELYTLLSSGLKSEENVKENNKEQSGNEDQNISSELKRDNESHFESQLQEKNNTQEEEACCGILDNSISHNSQCRSPRLKDFVDFSFIERYESNRQVYSPKTVRRKIFDDTIENISDSYILKPPSPKEISLLKSQNEEKSHSLSINQNKILFGCTKSGPQYDLHGSPKSDDSGPGILEMSFPNQIDMWQNASDDDVEHYKIENANSEISHLKNKSLIDANETDLFGYQGEIGKIQPISGLANESCVYDASDEDNMESDCPSNYDTKTLQKMKRECINVNQSLYRTKNSLMPQIKIEKDNEDTPFLMGNKNEKQSKDVPRGVISAPSTSRQIDLPFKSTKENIENKAQLTFENHDNIKNTSKLNKSGGIDNFPQTSRQLENSTYISASVQEQQNKYSTPRVQEQEFKYMPPKTCTTSLSHEILSSNSMLNTQTSGLEYLNDTYRRSREIYIKEAIDSKLRRTSTNLHSTEIESDESCDSIDYKQPSDRKLFTLIPPSLRRIYDSQEYNSSINSYNNQVPNSLKDSFHNQVLNSVLPQPSSSRPYSSSPRKKNLDNLWDKWASKSAMEESNSQSEETEQLSDTSNRSSPHSHFLLGSPSRKRKWHLSEEDKSLMASNKFSKIIYSYKKGGFVCRPTPQMLRKMSEMRKKEQESKFKLEKQKREEQEASEEFSKERENILRMTRDDMIERRKRLKEFRMRNFARRYRQKHLDESLTFQYRTKLAKEKEIQKRTLETVNQVKERSVEKNEVPENIIVMVDGKMHLYHRDPYKT